MFAKKIKINEKNPPVLCLHLKPSELKGGGEEFNFHSFPLHAKGAFIFCIVRMLPRFGC